MVAKSGKKKRKLNSKTIRQMLLIRKKFPEAFTAEGIVSCAVEPVLVNPIILIKAVTIFYSVFPTVKFSWLNISQLEYKLLLRK